MRTTITLDDDVAAKIQTRVRKSGRPFKDVVNEALRTGLAIESQVKQLPPFKIERQHLIRLRRGLNYDKVEEIFDQIDTPRRSR